MLITFLQADDLIIRQAIEIHQKLLEAANKALAHLNLPTLHVDADLTRLDEIRKFVKVNTSDGDLLKGERELKVPLDVTLRTSLWILLDKLGKLMEAEAQLFAPTNGTAERIAAVQSLRDRVDGQTTMTLEMDGMKPVTLTERQFDHAVESFTGKTSRRTARR